MSGWRRRLLVLVFGLQGCDRAGLDDVDVDDGTDADTVLVIDTGEPGCPRWVPPPPTAAVAAQGAFRMLRPQSGPVRSRCLVVEDLDADGLTDVLTISDVDNDPDQVAQLWVYWGGSEGLAVDNRAIAAATGFPEVMASGVCAAADLDGDGRFDILHGNGTELGALMGGPERTFTPVGGIVALDGALDAPIDHIALVDIDGSAPLDLIVGVGGRITECPVTGDDPGGGADVVIEAETTPGVVRCYRGSTDGFVPLDDPALCPSALRDIDSPGPYGLILADLDHDTRPDVFVGTDFDTNVLLLTGGDPGWEAPDTPTGLEVYDHAMGTAMADFDGDGRRDVFIGDVGPDALFQAGDCGRWFDAGLSSGLAQSTDRTVTWGSAGFDADHDGDVDILSSVSMEVEPGGFAESLCEVVDRQLPVAPFLLHLNNGDGTFDRVDIPLEGADGEFADWYAITMATGDLDGDGDLDVVTTGERGMRFLYNELETTGHWLTVRPMEEGRIAVGSRVVVRFPSGHRRMVDLYGAHGMSGHSRLGAHFGLGEVAGPVTVVIRWPGGGVSTFDAVDTDQFIDLHRMDGVERRRAQP